MSRIKIEPHEAEKLAGEIAAVLTYASSLQSVASKYQAVVSTAAAQETNVMREDKAVAENAQAILKQAPEREGDYFVVPRIIKQD